MSSHALEIDGFARWLVRRAAQRAPESLSERLEEEWLADLSAHGGPMSRLRFGLGCCWASAVILHEHCGSSAAAAAAAGSTTGQTTMTFYPHGEPPFLTLRTLALVLIACMHVVLIYALASALGLRMVAVTPPPITGDFLPALPKPPPPPPPDDPSLKSWQPDAPPLAPPPELPPPPSGDMTAIEGPPIPLQGPPQPPAPVNRIVGGPGKGFPNTAEYYSPASIRLAETGAASVRVCVDRLGRLTTQPAIVQSSGSPRLDESAIRLSQAGSGHYRPTTEDGRPVDSCYVFRVRFELRQ